MARKELLWETERQKLLLKRVRGYFLDVVAVESIELYAFSNGVRTTTFRTAQLPDDVRVAIREVHQYLDSVSRDISARDTARDSVVEDEGDGAGTGDVSAADQSDFTADERLQLGQSQPAGGRLSQMSNTSAGMSGTQQVNKRQAKVDERKRARAERRRMWDLLEQRKPSGNYEPPEDVERIRDARARMGYWMLKSAEDFEVPEHMQMNTSRKRREMLLLEESYFAIKMVRRDT